MTNDFWFEAKNITCFKNGCKVIEDLNLNLKYCENVILIGPNGSGKSSLIELINRTIYPVLTTNTVLRIFNKELIDIWEVRKKISTVNNEIKSRISPKLKIIDLIISGLHGKYCEIENKSEKDISLVENLMKIMNLKKLSQKNFYYLSEGEKQIVLIARALINKPEILILDEPTANLDLKSKFFVVDKINELSKLNTKIICITHDISIITDIYNRILMLKDRKLIADGNQKEVMISKNISKLFDINVDIIKHKGNWNIYRDNKY